MLQVIKKIFKKEFFKKDITIALLAAFVISSCVSLFGFERECQDLRDNILRLHILANSDSDVDQTIKLKVRDRLLSETNLLYSNIKTKQDAINITNENISFLKQVAQEEIKKYGAEYSVDISVGDAYFNTREYEDCTLPAGQYEAVRVLLGNAEGKNWWCIMFPSMCLPAAEKHTIDEAVDSASANIAQNPQKYVMRFKIVEIAENIRHFFKEIF